MDAVPLEKAPKVAVYAPPNAPPWDDAVTMALKYAGIKFEKIWDAEVVGKGLTKYDWLHLHHEDFTGQYSKFFLNYAGAPWLADMVQRNQRWPRKLGFPNVPAEKRPWRSEIRGLRGARRLPVRDVHRDRDARPGAGQRQRRHRRRPTPTARRWTPTPAARWTGARALAFQDAQLELSPNVPSFSDIDGHQVNARPAAAAGRVHAVQLQRQDRSGADDAGAEPPARHPRLLRAHHLVHQAAASSPASPSWPTSRARRGSSTSTASWGRAPGPSSAATIPRIRSTRSAIRRPICRCIPHSPGYRLILNNVLFPAAKKKELKT